MIAVVKGSVFMIDTGSIIVECSGIGYQIYVPANVLEGASIGSDILLYTHFHVKEDVVALYGFLYQDEKKLFEQLLTVNGVGPRGAMALISFLGAEGLRLAVVASDAKKISKAPGIGAKTAQKIILELKDKIDIEEALKPRSRNRFEVTGPANPAASDAVLALTALGYSEAEALKAVNQVEVADGVEADSDYYLKMALKKLF